MKRQAVWVAAFCMVLFGYGLFFAAQEKFFEQSYAQLKAVPSAQMMRIFTGYGRQLMAEVIFVQSAVFLGGLPAGTDHAAYMPTLAHNYKAAAQLYPKFNDTYYYAQSFLAGFDEASTRAANEILALGWAAYPDRPLYPFFQAFNLFSYLQQPTEAAAVFLEASRIPDAPPGFAHMAVLLKAEGGELEASLYSLQVLMRTTDDPERKELYTKEIDMFKQALEVQKAVSTFVMRNQRYPQTLEELVPTYLPALPDFGSSFDLTWNAPNVGLKRPRLRGADGLRSQQ